MQLKRISKTASFSKLKLCFLVPNVNSLSIKLAVGKSRMLESYTHQKKPTYQRQSTGYYHSNYEYHTEGIDFVSKVEEIKNE